LAAAADAPLGAIVGSRVQQVGGRTLAGLMESKDLTKIRIDLPNHCATGGESLWAKPVGVDTYEVRNTPFHAYDINFLDIVEARSTDPNLKPAVVRVVKRSGHRTLRVRFSDSGPASERVAQLESLAVLKVSFEGKNDTFFAIDVEPDGNYDAVCSQLAAWEKAGVLEYETCEARIEGSFDDRPGSDHADSAG
jgi:hypothetical protein